MNIVNVIIENKEWETKNEISSWIKFLDSLFETAIKYVYNGTKSFSVNLLLTGQIEIANLNRNFRNKNESTNVLSFPQYSVDQINMINEISSEQNIELGDIAMSFADISKEAENFRIPLCNRCTHLFIHGVLHLFGFDHIINSDQEKMENLEIHILGELGINNPYIIEEN